MIILPLEQLKEKIIKEAPISASELDSRIKAKMEDLSGLISEDGAAHIVANELGIQLISGENSEVKLNALKAGMRQIDITGKVTRKYEVRNFQTQRGGGKIGSFFLADDTASIRVVLWNVKADLLSSFNESDVLKISSVYVRDNNGRLEVHVNDRSEIHVNPEGVNVKVADAQAASVSLPSLQRKPIKELEETDQNVEILATIVDIFDIHFFTPRFEEQNGSSVSYVLNLIGDDGTDTIRIALWKAQVEHFLGMKEEEIVKFKDYPEQFQDVKHKFLGEIVKVVGRVKKNQMFNRLEFSAQRVFMNPDPKEELERLEAE